MRVRKTISFVDDGKNRVDVVETHYYEEVNTVQYKEVFDLLKKEGYIKSEFFEDTIWLLPCDIKLRNFKFLFNLDLYKNMNNVLKGYILLKRLGGMTPASCYNIFSKLKTLLFKTDGLSDVQKIKEIIAEMNDIEAWKYSLILDNFLDFYKPEKRNEIKNFCSSIPKLNYGSRDLPSFVDVLKFDEIIDEYFDNEDRNKSLKYYPILIWWKVTNIIPMRPIDFFELKSNCVNKDKNGIHWINLGRSKSKTYSPKRLLRQDSVEISKDIYNLILHFQRIKNELKIESDYLMPYVFFNKFHKQDKSSLRKIKYERVGESQFARLLSNFYKEIVNVRYGNLDKITTGDTRHFAIINLFLQGFNALTIARMAGHSRLEAQDNYYNHATHYAQSYVYHLAQKVHEENIALKTTQGFLSDRRYAIDRGIIHDDITHFKNVDYGYCSDTSDEFPLNCKEDCRVCDFYIFKPLLNEYDEGLKWLEDSSEKLNMEINKTIKMMEHLSTEMIYDLEKLSYQSNYQEKLSSHAYNVSSLLDRRAVIEAKILEERAKNEQEKRK